MTIHQPPQSDELDDFLTALADNQCRAVLRYVRDASEPTTTVTVLANDIAGPDEDTHQEAIRLHHRTLPRLDDMGLIDYQPADHTVRFRADEQVEAWVDALDGQAHG